tara:strand:+ start:605 stop:1066 length:462 start_codon:yes stop_codon:yes gene_type:complete
LKTASEQLADLKAMVDEFLGNNNTRFANFKEEFLLAADLSQEQISALTKDELFENAYILYSYASYIQDEMNMQKIALNWCNDKLNKMVAKNHDQFSKYTKYEERRPLIIVNDEYAATVDHYREIAESRVQSLEGKVYEVKRKADILLEKGKRS